jgi:T3SS EscN ATPase C-terminal domain
MPCESSSLARPAFKRASARPTMRREPNPISVGFPCHENLNTHFLVPDGETASQRPFPSQWRPGAAVSIICSVSLSPALRGRARIDCLAWTGEQNAAIAKLRRLIARYEDTRDLRLMGGYREGNDPELDSAVSLVPKVYDALIQSARSGPSENAFRDLTEYLQAK